MRVLVPLVVVVTLLAAVPVPAQDLASTCHASSSYDVTLRPDSVVFDRAAPTPRQVELRDGALRTDGVAVTATAETEDRLVLFERDLRALAPRVREVAQNGVDMAAQALRDEALGMGMSAATQTEFDRRLAAHVIELKRRIATSNSTHDWQGDLASQYGNQLAGDLLPLLAADFGQQAINAALAGDLQTAASLRDRGTALATQWQPRLQQRMQALRPQIAALCPAIQRLAALQQGVRGSDGRPLDLLQVGG